jgi:hypothetical protein
MNGPNIVNNIKMPQKRKVSKVVSLGFIVYFFSALCQCRVLMVLHIYPHQLNVAVGIYIYIYILYGPEWRRYMLGHGAVDITSRLEQRWPRRWDTAGDSDDLQASRKLHY